MKKFLVINSLFLAFSLLLTACTAAAPTQDPNQLAAQVAALVDSQVATKVAQALAALPTQQPAQPINTPMIPTVGPIPTLAPVNVPTLSLPGVATGIPCLATPRNEGENLPDGTSLVVNTAFTKKWTISNQGSCTWNANYKLKFIEGDQMGGPSFILFGASVTPWQKITLSLSLKTTDSVGTSTGYWGIYDDKDVFFGRVWVTINRTAVVPTSSSNAVTNVHIYQAASPTCTIYADITANGGGRVKYHWIINGVDGGVPTNTLDYTAAGTKIVTTIITSGQSAQIYIDSPNHAIYGSAVAKTC